MFTIVHYFTSLNPATMATNRNMKTMGIQIGDVTQIQDQCAMGVGTISPSSFNVMNTSPSKFQRPNPLVATFTSSVLCKLHLIAHYLELPRQMVPILMARAGRSLDVIPFRLGIALGSLRISNIPSTT